MKRTDVVSKDENAWKPYGTVGKLLDETPPFILRILGKKIVLDEVPDYIVPDFLKQVIQHVNILKKDKKHRERAHESLVEDFMVCLGYVKHEDIKFRQRRLDVTISINNKPLLLLEVKKNWSLSYYSDSDAVQQAYEYALDHGIRFVSITNGDYYAIFDRLKGLSIADNLIGEFTLTSLMVDDLVLIDKLRKSNLKNPNLVEIFQNLSEMFK